MGKGWKEIGDGMVQEQVSRSERSERRLTCSTQKQMDTYPMSWLIVFDEKDSHQGWRYVPNRILHKYAVK